MRDPIVAVLVACHNRRTTTELCLDRVEQAAANTGVRLFFVIVDDGSTDGTWAMLRERDFGDARVQLLRGDGGLFWAGGMRHAMTAGQSLIAEASHVLLLNDDTQLHPEALTLLLQVEALPRGIVVGTTVDPTTGKRTYGGLRRASSLRRLTFVPVEQAPGARCETMNANAVLVGAEAFANIGPFDDRYTHSLADIDYGLRASRMGFTPRLASDVVGTCPRNDPANTWRDRTLSRSERIRALRSPKGLPPAEWAHFALRHGGPLAPAYIASPFVRIALGL